MAACVLTGMLVSRSALTAFTMSATNPPPPKQKKRKEKKRKEKKRKEKKTHNSNSTLPPVRGGVPVEVRDHPVDVRDVVVYDRRVADGEAGDILVAQERVGEHALAGARVVKHGDGRQIAKQVVVDAHDVEHAVRGAPPVLWQRGGAGGWHAKQPWSVFLPRHPQPSHTTCLPEVVSVPICLLALVSVCLPDCLPVPIHLRADMHGHRICLSAGLSSMSHHLQPHGHRVCLSAGLSSMSHHLQPHGHRVCVSAGLSSMSHHLQPHGHALHPVQRPKARLVGRVLVLYVVVIETDDALPAAPDEPTQMQRSGS
jgi:hypothetical protein